ncbi:hypothetical protein GTA08_BOTSDO07784 [Botryosphaeria dothidea]|uniref:SnoaL-like domain-containing protein n=1 Tax=Botryosphaeria dothidea TaxID=55169 RepID=A0A8H4IMB8_9PEZI|nr:hypothetical protein GTA08_BOTSDO07784 [Botryosphaeria dothidea]
MSPKYASKEHIQDVFSHMAVGDYDGFFANVVPDVQWTVQSKTILGGTYNNRDEFRTKTFGRLGKIMDPEHPVHPKVHNIVGGGDDEWAMVEMTNTSKTKTGLDYNNTFCWATRWNTEGKIVQVRAYLDTALVQHIVDGTEGKI